MGLGIGTPTTTALGSEITTGGGERAAVTPSSQTTTVTGDTIRSTNTYSFTDTFAVTEEGLFNAVSSGDMIASRSFSAINVANGDSLQITHDIVFSAS
jgi:Cu/Ag efflux protein CusF